MRYEKYSYMPLKEYYRTWFIGWPLRFKHLFISIENMNGIHLMDEVVYNGKKCFVNNGIKSNEKGERLSREPWTVLYADSEDVSRVNCSVDKVFDLQESTYWRTERGKQYPHYFIIDLGAEHSISGMQYLPRMESNVPGGIKDYKMFVK